MFIQVVKGKVKDAAAALAASESWEAELKPGAKGYLGTTEGVADDGTFVAIVRFASEADARANSDRPEQGAWWEKTSKMFDGAVTFYDCPRVEVFNDGGSDDAGFVQVMVYKPSDVDKILAMAKEFEKLAPMRPDIMGGTTGIASDGTVIDTNYFSSETAARDGESQMMTPEVQSIMERFNELAGPIEFIDLRNPRFSSA